jgi:deoxyribodipyrimidine photolyase-related protein
MATVEKHFFEHPGSTKNVWFPVTRLKALELLDDFLIQRLENFGAYEDAMLKDRNFLFHSCISALLNIGLITPDIVIEKALDLFKQNKAPLNSIEGFVRQILGWREFVRGIYQLRGAKQKKSNFWGHQRKLSQSWYDGSTGLLPLDDCINTAVKDGYSHHIPRLMVICNLMNMCEINPKYTYKWFIEMYIDASDWVMIPNVFGMATYSDGGLMSTKPYTCSSNYILKMSNYERGAWCDVIDGLYWRFIEKNIDFYSSNPRLSFQTRVLSRMSEDRKTLIFKKAEEFLVTHTV